MGMVLKMAAREAHETAREMMTMSEETKNEQATTGIEAGETTDGATFEMPADDPRRTENRGGLEATLGVDGGIGDENNRKENDGKRSREVDDGTGGHVMSGDNTVGTLMTGNTG